MNCSYKFNKNINDNETISFSRARATFVHIKQNPSNHDQSKELCEVQKHLFQSLSIQFFLSIPKSFQRPPNANDLFSNSQAAG